MSASEQAVPIHVDRRMVPGPLAWIAVVIVFFGGEEFGYISEVGEATLPEAQAEAAFQRLGGMKQVYHRFLNEVQLKTRH